MDELLEKGGSTICSEAAYVLAKQIMNSALLWGVINPSQIKSVAKMSITGPWFD